MRKGFLGSLGVLLAGTGLALAQQAPAYRPAQWVPYQPAQGAPPAHPRQAYPGYPPTSQAYAPQVQVPQGNLPPRSQPAVNGVGPLPTLPVVSQPAPTVQPQLPAERTAPLLSLPMDQPETVPAPKEKKPDPNNPPVASVPEGDCEGNAWCVPEYPGAGEVCADECEKTKGCWASLEYLYWRLKDAPLNAPLLAQGAVGGVPTTPIDVLDTDYDYFHGGRATVGFWLAERLGVEASGFYLPEQGNEVQTAGDGTSVLGRPAFNVATGLPSALLISSPGLATGTFDAELSSTLWGAEVNAVLGVVCRERLAINFLVGGRYARFDEELSVGSTTNVQAGGLATFAGAPLPAGSSVRVEDNFETRNKFYGGQVGIQGGIQSGKFFFGLTARLAIGVTERELEIGGSSSVPGTPNALPAGLLAVGSNSGTISDTVFSLLPEGRVEIGCQLFECVNLTLGYNYLYWTRVSRPGSHVSSAVSGTQVPVSGMFGAAGPAAPTVTLQDGDFWARGLTAGIAIRY